MEKICDKTNLLGSLGELINKKIQVLASEKKDHLSLEDDAVEHAKAYRMLGWNWDQIDTILEDMEFEPAIVKEALNRAQQYFEETLKDGPFSMFVLGQLIKLKNGFVGKLLDKYPSKLQVRVSGDDLLISESQIDLDASLKLKEAFVLRTTANELLKTANADAAISLPEEKEDSNKPVLSMLSGLIGKIEASKKAILEAKEPFKNNKRVLSSLGLEFAVLEDLEEGLKELQTRAANVSIPEFAKTMDILASVNMSLDSFKDERTVLASHTVEGADAAAFAGRVKELITHISQDVVPNITQLSNDLFKLMEDLEKTATAKKVSAVLQHVNKE